MRQAFLPIIAIATSLFAIGLSLSNRARETGDADALDSLDQRLGRLESALAIQSEASGRKLSGLRNDPANSAADRSADDEIIDNLRGQQQQLETRLSELGVLEHFEDRQRAIEAAHGLALDPNADAKDRLEALGVLRKANRVDDQIVASMVDLWDESVAQGTKGGWTRWFLLENLEGVQDAALRDSILEWIPDEESPKMRSRAIETLGSMLPDPSIDEWLDYLAGNDPDPELRQQAAATRAVGRDGK